MSKTFVIHRLTGRVIVLIVIVAIALLLQADGHDLATALLVSVAIMGIATDAALRVVPVVEAR